MQPSALASSIRGATCNAKGAIIRLHRPFPTAGAPFQEPLGKGVGEIDAEIAYFYQAFRPLPN